MNLESVIADVKKIAMASVENTAIFAPVPVMERGTSYVLGADPKGKNILYTNGKDVVIRDVENPKECDLYAQHAHKVCVAQYATSGFYICSGDMTGKIRIWDTVNKEHILKNEFQPISGQVMDLQWDPDSKRIVICGKGRDKHAAAILADSGNNVGKLDNILKAANTISYKQTRPFRVAVGDDGFEVKVYEGPPFKVQHALRDHSRFVNSVRYSPDGKYLATASSDGHVFLYDGKTTEKLGELGCEKSGAHPGGIYSISWSPDSKELLTVSGDKSAKIWDMESKKEVFQITFGDAMTDQQYSSLWMGNYILSVSLSGYINYIDRNDPSKPARVLRGHAKSINKVLVLPGGAHVTGDISGIMLKWNTESGYADAFSGAGHTNKISGLAYDATNKQVISVAWDDKVKFTCVQSLDYASATTVSTGSQPIAMSLAADGYLVLLCHAALVLFKDKKKVFEIPHEEDYTPAALAANGKTVAVNGQGDTVKIYNIEHDSLVDSGISFPAKLGAAVLSFSPDGSKLAVATVAKLIQIHDVTSDYKKMRDLLGHHMRPSCLAWTPDSEKLASSGMDASLRVWNIATKRREDVQGAHALALITDLAWLDDNRLLTVGDDCVTKEWAVCW